jgi:hypothetical protein
MLHVGSAQGVQGIRLLPVQPPKKDPKAFAMFFTDQGLSNIGAAKMMQPAACQCYTMLLLLQFLVQP